MLSLKFRSHRVIRLLVVCSILFGGFLLGVGNAVFDTDHSDHHGDGGRHHTEHVELSFNDGLLPANCLFCLDGLPPSPTSRPDALVLDFEKFASYDLLLLVHIPRNNIVKGFQSRAPPNSLFLF